MQSGTCLGLHALPDCVTVMTMNEKPHISEICAGLDPYALSGDFAARGYEVGQHAGVEACIAALDRLSLEARAAADATDARRSRAELDAAHDWRAKALARAADVLREELAAGMLLK